ncbi:MAG: hypothetical protein CBE24_03315 [bacterium TMED264]|nr:MAG: hypothetical protein CBE24_03315 [bacterium TMED264]
MSIAKISVGITAYKNSKYIFEALNSLINQSVDNWEGIFILDKGADKATQKIFDGFNHPKFFKYKCTTHKGAEQARHKAIKLSSTKWFFQLDSDDKIPPYAINEILNKISENPKAEFIYGPTMHFSKKSSYVMKPSRNPEVLTSSALFSAIMPIKISMYFRIGGYAKELKYFAADWDFWLSVYEKNIVGAETKKIIYHRRNHDNNVISRNISRWPEVISIIITRHPKYFYNNERKRKALYYVYEKLARHYRSKSKRKKAAIHAKIALKNGKSTTALQEILNEEKMSKIRYAIRLLGKLF